MSILAQGNRTVDCTTVQMGSRLRRSHCPPTTYSPPCSGTSVKRKDLLPPRRVQLLERQLVGRGTAQSSFAATTSASRHAPRAAHSRYHRRRRRHRRSRYLPRRHKDGPQRPMLLCRSGLPGSQLRARDHRLPLNAPRKADGSCCNARDLQTGACGGTTDLCANGKAKVDGKCPQLCPDGSTPREHSHIPCPTKAEEKKKPRHTTPRKPRPKTDSDNPEKASPSLPLQIQIGPGFPSGGRPGGKPSGGTPKGGGNCLKQYCG